MSETDLATRHGLQLNQLQHMLAEAKTTLLGARNKRKPPLRDDKIITAWNGLMIAAMAKAGFVLDRPDYLTASQRAANFILDSILVNGRLQRIHLNNSTQETAFLNDYAFLFMPYLSCTRQILIPVGYSRLKSYKKYRISSIWMKLMVCIS